MFRLYVLLALILIFPLGCGGSNETGVAANEDEIAKYLKDNPDAAAPVNLDVNVDTQ